MWTNDAGDGCETCGLGSDRARDRVLRVPAEPLVASGGHGSDCARLGEGGFFFNNAWTDCSRPRCLINNATRGVERGS